DGCAYATSCYLPPSPEHMADSRSSVCCHCGCTVSYTLSLALWLGSCPANGSPRGSTMSCELRCRVKYDHSHCARTRHRLPGAGRNAMWMKAHTSHAGSPLSLTTPAFRMAKPRPTTAMLPLSK